MEATKFIYVAIDTQRKTPIATADDLNDLFAAVDYNFGAHEDFKHESMRVSWTPDDDDYPFECEGTLRYIAPDYEHGDGQGKEMVEVKIYTVDYFEIKK